MASKYTNPISITSARKITVQQPSDDRGEFETIAAVTASIVADEHYAWFEYMLSYIKEVHQICAWLDAAALPSGVTVSDLIVGTAAVYPAGYPDVQYAGKTFGFYSLKSVPRTHTHTESEISDLDKYTQAEVDSLLGDKEDALPANATGSIAYLTKNAANDTYSWVVFSGLTAPTNTGDLYAYNNGWQIIRTDPSEEAVGGQTHRNIMLPKRITLAPGTYSLRDPSTLTDGFCAMITHDNSSASLVNLTAYQIDNQSVPLALPQYKSICIVVDNGQWKQIDNFT